MSSVRVARDQRWMRMGTLSNCGEFGAPGHQAHTDVLHPVAGNFATVFGITITMSLQTRIAFCRTPLSGRECGWSRRTSKQSHTHGATVKVEDGRGVRLDAGGALPMVRPSVAMRPCLTGARTRGFTR